MNEIKIFKDGTPASIFVKIPPGESNVQPSQNRCPKRVPRNRDVNQKHRLLSEWASSPIRSSHSERNRTLSTGDNENHIIRHSYL